MLVDASADRRGDKHRPDVSLILTLHAEGPLVRRTLLSLDEAAHYARRLGISSELVAVLDRATEPTRRALEGFDSDAFAQRQTIQVDHGSLGPSRNAGIAAAHGRYLMMCDGDDLISFNSLAEMFQLAEASPPGTVVFPEYLLAFGERHHFVRYYPLEVVTPLSFLRAHPYISRIFAPRDVFRAVGYLHVPLSEGYAYEDWHFNAECAARGHAILTARDTMLFYRQRSGSLLALSDALTVRQIPPSRLFEPSTFRRVTRESYTRVGRNPSVFTRERHKPTPADLDRPILRALIQAANGIEPAIELALVQPAAFFSNIDQNVISVGLAYYEICELIEGSAPFDEVFLLPYDGIGGAETFLRNVMFALHEAQPNLRLLVVYGEQASEAPADHSVPPGTTVIDLGRRWPHLDPISREIVTLRVIESVAPRARLHIRDSSFACDFFRNYWPVLRGHRSVFYRFSDAVVWEGDDLFHRAPGFNFVSAHIEKLETVVSDTETLVERDRWRIGVWPERFQCLASRRPPLVDDAQVTARTARRKNRVLWASRLDPEKRPELVPRVARQLFEVAPCVAIDMFGRSVLGRFDVVALDAFANLNYRGPYDAFEGLDHSAYDCFLYTSWFDGLPNVVLEAIAAGLPVIAPAVGGIGEMVVDDETGILLAMPAADDDAARLCVDAIMRLLDDDALRSRLARAALQRLQARHGAEAYAKRVRTLFFPADAQS